MRLEALHHITMITGDAQANVDFYAGTLGLRLVKKTVNFDQPEAYHLYFGDEQGSPGSILTWFEFAGAERGRAGAGAIHLIQLAVPSERSLEFWAARLGVAGPRFEDYDGLAFELVVDERANPPLRAARSATVSESSRQESTSSSSSRCSVRKCAPTTLQCICLPSSERSSNSTRVAWSWRPVSSRSWVEIAGRCAACADEAMVVVSLS